jgi:cyclophilin family peptidyl-prolyl cis-trans isomerase
MHDLIKTTYERSFDKNIISKYLHTDDERKIHSAILSIAHSEDTTLVPDLIKLDMLHYGSDVCFALGQIGRSEQSLNFLWDNLQAPVSENFFGDIFYTIGKIGNQNDFKKLIDYYKSYRKSLFPYEGIAEGILQFQIRGIKSEEAKAILEIEITHPLSTKNRIKQALFTLARYGDNNLSKDNIGELLNSDFAREDDQFLTFVLMNINNKNSLEIASLNLSGILNSTDFSAKIQLIKVLHLLGTNLNSFPAENIKLYLSFLNDSNPNAALQSAISIKNIKPFLNDVLKSFIKSETDSMMFDITRSADFIGELFLSKFELFGNYEDHKKLLNHIKLGKKYCYRFYAKNPDLNNAFKLLYDSYFSTSDSLDRITLLSLMLSIKDKVYETIELKQVILSALQSSFAPLISIAADAIDVDFVAKNKRELKDLIFNQINSFKDKSDYLEAVISLVNLSEKIDQDFYTEIINNVKLSKLYSIRRFVSNKTEDHNIGFKELDKFEEIWTNAFKYEKAIIKTTKGNIEIEFDSEVAPVSVANFCTLVKENFFNKIVFHRVVPGFVIQAGDPTSTGWGGPGYDIISEFSDKNFNTGYVGMASAGKDTESSQFFIMQGSYPHLNRRYTLFGKVINGLEIVFSITENDKILSVELK